jgi:hypothetical protein
MKDWKTTLCSTISAIAGFIALNDDLFPKGSLVIRVAQFVTVGGLMAFGIAAKDSK